MKNFLILFAMLFCFKSNAVKTVKFDSIGFGSQLKIDGLIELPNGQKLNEQAPSKIAIYEQDGKEWTLTKTIDINEFFSLSEIINFNQSIKLKSDTAKIKIETSLFHCPRLGKGICVIDDFEGVVERNQKKKSTNLKLALRGSEPK